MTGPVAGVPAAFSVSLAGLGLLSLCDSHANWQDTGGFISLDALRSFGPEAEVAKVMEELHAAGIAVPAIRDGARGWQVTR